MLVEEQSMLVGAQGDVAQQGVAPEVVGACGKGVLGLAVLVGHQGLAALEAEHQLPPLKIEV